MIRSPYYAMKRRLGGEKLTPREKLLSNSIQRICPGCQPHAIQSQRRKDILFDHYFSRPDKSYIVYWRSHPAEYKAIINRV